jgi:hypothetical protein
MMAGYQAALHASLAGLSAFHTLMWDTPSLFSDDSQPDSLTRWLRRWLSDRILGHGLRSGGRTIVNSRYLKGESERLYGANVAIARMGGLEGAARPRPAVTAPDAIFSLLSVCRVEANKRIDWILRALAALEARDPPLSHRVNWRLDVVGGGPLIAPLAALAQNLGMAERVRFHGFLDDQDLELLYAQARIFVMPARQGYGIPAIEALQRGIPVLLHRESGVSDILDDTPWCGVFDGPASAMPAALDSMIDRVLSGTHDAAPLPALPTEAAWAEDVARHCGWIK